MTYQITEADIDAFTNGDCWALAKEISKRTGWQVEALGAYPEDKIDSPKRSLHDFDWVHVVVRTPGGEYLDVNGIHVDAQKLVDAYENHVYGHYGWHAEDFDFEPLLRQQDWDALSIRYRIYPKAPVAKVAASLIGAYRSSR